MCADEYYILETHTDAGTIDHHARLAGAESDEHLQRFMNPRFAILRGSTTCHRLQARVSVGLILCQTLDHVTFGVKCGVLDPSPPY